jgi:oxygen-independent coproporphyrinogen-3 oxidase
MRQVVLTREQKNTYLKYAGLSLPRHTSYPIVPVWQKDPDEALFAEHLIQELAKDRDVSLYVHIPFCGKACYYCGCNRLVVGQNSARRDEVVGTYLSALYREIERYRSYLAGSVVQQLHFGGGTPTYLTAAELATLLETLKSSFAFAADADLSIEVDPRVTTSEQLQLLRGFGMKRLSMGVQDFEPVVQRAIGREQSFDMVAELVAEARALGFDSINFDLIYGLPFQTTASMERTIQKVLRLAPDRIAYFRLAVLPDLFKLQRLFKAEDLPVSADCLELMLMAINLFGEAGYEFIGLDHFAAGNDPLARAYHERTLTRTFQGMTTGKGLNLIGIGASSISMLDGCYMQNQKEVAFYGEQIHQGFPWVRGMILSQDDKLRREVLQQLYCYGKIDFRLCDEKFGIDSQSYFAKELQRLQLLLDDGLVALDQETVTVTDPLGRMLVRVVAAAFDRYLPENAFQAGLAAGQASTAG